MTRTLNLFLVLVLTFSLALTACGGGDDKPADQSAQSAGDADRGKDLFAATCAACHGPNGEGVQGLGKPFANSEFLKGKSDDDLLAFVKKGRPPGDPDNTTGVDMPPKGGNPALSDDGLRDIIAFLRTLQ